MTQLLKTKPQPFSDILSGAKTFEFRRDDRTPRFEVGDWLFLLEWENHKFTGRECAVEVTHLLRGPGYGIPRGYCCMSIKVVAKDYQA
jgi:ParB family transcriptional regulator, chromosome partitioning protein